MLTMLVTLYNTCGGVIFLTREGTDLLAAEVVKLFGDRFLDMISHKTGLPIRLFLFIETSLMFEADISWGALIVPSKTEENQAGIQADFCVDIDGDISPIKQKQGKTLSLNKHANEGETGAADGNQILGRQGAPSTGQDEQPPPEDDSRANGKDADHEVDYSAYQTLDWTNNKEEWEKYVNIKKVETNEILTSCDMLQPQLPMTVTPERDQLQYMFQSVNDMERVLATCRTDRNRGGFAICL